VKKLRYIFAAALSGIVLFMTPTVLAHTFYVGATASQDACETLKDLNPNGGGCTASQGGVNSVIKLALNLLSIIAGVIGVIMVIVAGFKYITAQGDAASITSARNALLYAIVGLVVVAFAQAIVKFVLSRSINA
jgi:hypothetical protein